MIRLFWATLIAPIRDYRRGLRELRDQRQAAERAATVEHRRNRLLAGGRLNPVEAVYLQRKEPGDDG